MSHDPREISLTKSLPVINFEYACAAGHVRWFQASIDRMPPRRPQCSCGRKLRPTRDGKAVVRKNRDVIAQIEWASVLNRDFLARAGGEQ